MDSYFIPGTQTLRNRFGILDEGQLEDAERCATYYRSLELSVAPVPGHFDLEHLKAIHHALFRDVYDWAGQLRTVDIARTGLFCHHLYIESSAAGIFAELAEEECLKGLPEADFVERSAYYLAEINALHPFREGNGRTQRQFIRQLGHDCGHTLDWSVVTQAEMISASIFSLDSAPSKLADLIARAMGGSS